ncbi:hypothetical protein LTR53_015822 [Teratosphaeriaceae sp. CCFEE 6253]|nr:hypothetical protein LTR53_015822 [Teratosphaeriaceae sp. CCFEE 6253]
MKRSAGRRSVLPAAGREYKVHHQQPECPGPGAVDVQKYLRALCSWWMVCRPPTSLRKEVEGAALGRRVAEEVGREVQAQQLLRPRQPGRSSASSPRAVMPAGTRGDQVEEGQVQGAGVGAVGVGLEDRGLDRGQGDGLLARLPPVALAGGGEEGRLLADYILVHGEGDRLLAREDGDDVGVAGPAVARERDERATTGLSQRPEIIWMLCRRSAPRHLVLTAPSSSRYPSSFEAQALRLSTWWVKTMVTLHMYT